MILLTQTKKKEKKQKHKTNKHKNRKKTSLSYFVGEIQPLKSYKETTDARSTSLLRHREEWVVYL